MTGLIIIEVRDGTYNKGDNQYITTAIKIIDLRYVQVCIIYKEVKGND